MKSSKKKSGGLFMFLAIAVLLGFFGVAGIVLLDLESAFRAASWDKNLMLSVAGVFKVKRIDTSSIEMLGVGFIYGSLVVAIGLLLLKGGIQALFAKKKVPAKLVTTVLCVISLGIFVLGWAAALGLCVLKDIKLKYFFLTLGYFGLSFVTIVIIGALVFLLLSLIGRAFRAGGSGSAQIAGVAGDLDVSSSKKETGEIFPDLKRIDEEFAGKEVTPISDNPPCSLTEFIERFQAYLAVKQELYYDRRMLRSFTAGLATSRLIILEGLSGTGKSSLPRWFAEFVGSKTFFAPVQSTWRDRTDVLGFYNDFGYVFKETDFLKRMYQSSYTHNNFNLMVLDEMNLSRVEYYFADFLSVLEYPPEDWRITLMTALDPKYAPKNIQKGAIAIPVNTWFVGTANKDDSTFTITDKVYDRAVVLDFKERNSKIETTADPEPINMTPGQLMALFDTAIRTEEYRLTPAELQKFVDLSNFVYDLFEIRFGNRIMNQITSFVPAYVGLGGTKEEAIDIMFARKVLHKLEGRFEDYIKDGLIRLQSKIAQVYGHGVLEETEELMGQLLKKLV